MRSSKRQIKALIRLCGMPFGYGNEEQPGKYLTVLSRHSTLPNALEWGKRSGLAAGWSTDYERQVHLWIEDVGSPATLLKVWN